MSKWTTLLEESPLNPQVSNKKRKLMETLNEKLEKDVRDLEFLDLKENEVEFIISTLTT